eukprot:TRINITY_DN1243_c0_g1_i4.p1 TRINITY_DN1243_c0_g1~~TRINITY_DN1243_c0_g1_i4.p1  ORF type:complete len:111 (+),score=15.89 TRINITY_DN1243_c0_g1_i4:78-410(+)
MCIRDRYKEEGGVFVKGLKDVTIKSEYDMFILLKEANKNQQGKNMHAIYRLTMTVNDSETSTSKIGCLNLVDLTLSKDNKAKKEIVILEEVNSVIAVSYTHLTLPTNREV